MMMRRLLAASVLLTACHSAAPATVPSPASRADWTAYQLQISQEVSAGRYGVADRLLGEFATRYPASSEAVEAMYWRALYKLDPANQTGSPHDAAVLLDGYLATPNAPRRTEAAMLRRVAAALELRQTASTTVVPPKVDQATTDEVARLKDELAKANAELERIKRRLAQPTKP